jgi:hypothetical protein
MLAPLQDFIEGAFLVLALPWLALLLLIIGTVLWDQLFAEPSRDHDAQ